MSRPPAGFQRRDPSILERIRDDDPEARREAFGDLVEGYWKPVYKHLRLTWRADADEASDLTQAFFADAYQKSWLERYEPSKARFRTFVRVCADRFVMNQRQAATRLKRGGGVQTIPLDFEGAEREVAAARDGAADPDERFTQEFVRALFDKAVQDLRAETTRQDARQSSRFRALRPRARSRRQLRCPRRRVRADDVAGDERARAGAPPLP